MRFAELSDLSELAWDLEPPRTVDGEFFALVVTCNYLDKATSVGIRGL